MSTISKQMILAGTLVLLIAAKSNTDILTQMADEAASQKMREKILKFKSGGAGYSINLQEYDLEGVIQFAESMIGTRHRMGGTSAKGVDCSGLVQLAHSKVNVALPHSSQEQARFGTIIPPGGELKRGDLVFFHSTYKTPHLVTHAGIYLGDDKFIHASVSQGVTITSIRESDYWSKHYLFATRLTAE